MLNYKPGFEKGETDGFQAVFNWDYDAGFSYQVRVTLIMSSQVKESLIELAGRYSDEGDFLRFPNGMILNYPFLEIDSIDNMYDENDEITFIYYIP